MAATVTVGTLRAYRPYWRKVVGQWGGRRLDEPTPSEVKQFVAHVKASAVPRRNSRGGSHAAGRDVPGVVLVHVVQQRCAGHVGVGHPVVAQDPGSEAGQTTGSDD